MKKVLFTATVDSHIKQFHLPYLKWFKEHGYEVHVATNGNEKIPFCDVKHKISFERSPIKINNLKAIYNLKKIIEREKFDIIHCHTPMGSVVTRLAAIKARKKYRTKVIYTAHGFHFFKGAPLINWIIYYPVEKICARWTDCLITINKEDYELAKKKFKKVKNIEYVHGVGIEESKFNDDLNSAEKNKLKKELKVTDKDYLLLYVAEISNRKNQIMLINTIKELKDKNRNVVLILAGKDSMNGECQKYAKNIGVEKNIRFLGYRNDINKLMKLVDLAVSCSKQEGLPVNIMEALCSGLRVVATECRGNKELINNKNGKLVEINNIKEMTNAIEYEMKNKGKKRIENYLNSNYYIENVIKEYENIYLKYERKYTVVHILNSNKFSGAENVAITIINQLNNNKDFKCMYMSPEGNIKKILKDNNIKYIPVKKLSCRKIRKVCKKYNVDIIHAHDFKASIFSAFSRTNSKIVSHIHKNDPKMKKVNLYSILFLISTLKYEKIIMVSKAVANEFKFNKFIEKKVKVIGNPVDTKKIVEKSKKQNGGDKYDIVYLGRLSPEKNPVEFIEIINELNKKNKEIKAVMIGDGKLKNECMNKIYEYGLINNIKMLGFTENPYIILKNSKIMCITSNWEGFGLAAIEGLALGLPVIAKNVGGLKEIVTNDCGILYSNIQEAVQNIEEILKDTELLKAKSQKAKNRAKKLENIKKYTNDIINIYET